MTNQYQDSDGLWIGPRDDNGRPKYETRITITATDSFGTVCDEWTADNEMELPDTEDMQAAIEDCGASVQFAVRDANYKVIADWIVFEGGDVLDTDEIHETIIKA